MPWVKGQSGNPNGRPPGRRNRATLLAQALLEEEAVDIVRKVIDLAKSGDPVAMRVVFERLVPPARWRPVRFDLPSDLEAAGAMQQALRALLRAVAQGEITPQEGQAVAAVIGAAMGRVSGPSGEPVSNVVYVAEFPGPEED